MDRGNNEITDVDSGNIRTYDSPNTKTAAAVSIGSSNDASSIAATSTFVIADMDVASADCASTDPVPQGRIRKIDAKSVQRIVAGQAVTDLASAVKELVDNSLDAASQSINSTYYLDLMCQFCFPRSCTHSRF